MGRAKPDAVFLPGTLVARIATLGAVADHYFRFGSRETLLDCSFDEFVFMRLSVGDAAGDRRTFAICDRHDFAAFSLASQADSGAFFFAELNLASMKVADRSRFPRAQRLRTRKAPAQTGAAKLQTRRPTTGKAGIEVH